MFREPQKPPAKPARTEFVLRSPDVRMVEESMGRLIRLLRGRGLSVKGPSALPLRRVAVFRTGPKDDPRTRVFNRAVVHRRWIEVEAFGEEDRKTVEAQFHFSDVVQIMIRVGELSSK